MGRTVGAVNWIYGMRDLDGDYGAGTIFRIQVTGAGFEVLHHFADPNVADAGANPSGPLVEAADGIFYGTTTGGGDYNTGTLFRLDTTVSPPTVTTLYSFPSLTLANEGPYGGVIVSPDSVPGRDVLFGTAGSPGLVYRIDTDGTPAGTSYQSICFTQAGVSQCSFGNGSADDPGSQPQGVIEGADGLLYGTLGRGPDSDTIHGRIFRMQKDGSGFEVLAVAPGLIVGPPVEIETAGNRWIYAATGVGDGTFPTGAPDGSIFRVLADGSFSERVHTFDPTIFDLGGPPTGRLVGMPDRGGVYGLTSHSAGACTNGFGCGSVYRAVGPTPYPLKVFQNNENSRTPQGAPALLSDGRLLVMTAGQFGLSTIHVINHPATDPLLVSGSATAQSTIQTFGTATYAFSVTHRNESTRPLANLQVFVDASPALRFTSQSSGDGWSCVQPVPDIGQFRCEWNGTLVSGATTSAHQMHFAVSPFGGFSPECAAQPQPCTTFRADLVAAGTVLSYDVATTAVTVIHPNTGLPNTPPIAGDDTATVRGLESVTIDVTLNDYSNPAEADVLSYAVVSPPAYGQAYPRGDGRFIYEPFAQLTVPDTFTYRVTDTFGASDTATVTLSPPQGFTQSKTFIDLGYVRQGEAATGGLTIFGPGPVSGLALPITFVPVPPDEIVALFQQHGSTHDPQAAVFDPDAFRTERGWFPAVPSWLYYRAPAQVPPGRVSVVRALFADENGVIVGSAVLVAESTDALTGPRHAVPDTAETSAGTRVSVDVTANDVPYSPDPQYAVVAGCSDYIGFLFDGAVCQPPPGTYGVTLTSGHVFFEPPAGFVGTTTLSYASGDRPVCPETGYCRFETTIYWSTLTINVGDATPPNLVSTKAILNQGVPVSAIEAATGDTVLFRIGAVNEPPPGGPPVGITTAPIIMTDVLPAGLAFMPAQSDPRCSASGQWITCTSPATLGPGDGVTFDIAATVVANPLPGNAVALYNEVVAATSSEITTSDNVSDYVQVLVRGPVSADLALSISAGAASVQVGQPMTVTATITNLGPNAASTVTLSGFDALTGFDQFAIAPAANCPVPTPGAPLVCAFPFLGVNAPVTVTITGTPRVAAPSVLAAGSVSALEPDPIAINNSATTSFAVTPGVIPPNLRGTTFLVDASEVPVSSLTVNEGDTVQVRIGAANASTAGPTTGSITVSDTLPAALTSPVALSAGCTVSGQVVTCVSNTVLQPGGLTAFIIQATAGPAPEGSSVTVQNVATATTPDDSDASDDVSAPVSLTILGARRADVSVTLSTLPSAVLVDQVLTLTAVIANGGPNDAELILFRGFASLLQPGFRDVAFSTTRGVCGIAESGAFIDCNVQGLAPGTSATITVTAVPTSDLFSGTADAQVSVNVGAGVAPSAADVEPANNQAVVPVAVRRTAADLATSLVLGRATVAVREPVTATVTVVNNGPQSATQVSVVGLAAMTGYDNLQIASTQGTCQVTAAPAVGCALGTIAAGASAQVTVTGTPAASSLSTTLSVLALGADLDPVTPNNSASATLAVTNTPAGTNVTVPLTTSAGAAAPVTVTFSSTTGGQTVANPVAGPPPLPSGFQVASLTYDISTTASFTPPVTVCIDGTFGANDYLLHYENGAWVQLPNQQRLPATGPPFTRVCAETMSLSPFVVARRTNRAPTVNAGPDQVLEATSPAGALATVSATANDPDSDSLSYAWSGGCGAATGATATLPCPLGTSAVTVSVSDGVNAAVTASLTVTVRDTTPPAITITRPVHGAFYAVGEAVTVGFACADGGSGVQSCVGTQDSGAALPTSVPGTYTFLVDASDAAGNTSSRSVSYTVGTRAFTFSGFFSPVDNPPVFNVIKAGSAVPLRFSLGGNYGLSVLAPGYPRVELVSCSSAAPTDTVEETVTAGGSGLQYDPLTDRYTYVWKTKLSMKGRCWRVTLRFTDGSSQHALFSVR